MGTNKDQPSESERQAIYEEAVLNFLDQEMAAGQSNKQQNEQGQEVDELVTDLLKQVFTESDQSDDGHNAASGDLEDIIAEFPSSTEDQQDGEQRAVSGDGEDPSSQIPVPMEAEETPPVDEDLEFSDEREIPPEEDAIETAPEEDGTEAPPEEAGQDRPEESVPEIASSQPPVSLGAPELGLNVAPRSKAPMMAVALILLLIAIGFAVYHFWGSSKSAAEAPESKPASTAAIAAENPNPMDPLAAPNSNTNAPPAFRKPNPTKPESASPVRKGAAAEKTPPKPAEKSPSASSSGSAPASPNRKSPAPKPEPAAAAAVKSSTDPVSSTEPSPLIVSPSTAQTPVSSPLTAASNLALDKSTPPPMPDGINLANPAAGRNRELAVSAILTEIQNKNPATEEPENLVPSVLISKATPVYPELAIRSRISGTVVLDLQVDETGKVVEATPVSGPSVFYSEAVKAAMKCSYRPASIDGTKVSSKSRITMVFNLK